MSTVKVKVLQNDWCIYCAVTPYFLANVTGWHICNALVCIKITFVNVLNVKFKLYRNMFIFFRRSQYLFFFSHSFPRFIKNRRNRTDIHLIVLQLFLYFLIKIELGVRITRYCTSVKFVCKSMRTGRTRSECQMS